MLPIDENIETYTEVDFEDTKSISFDDAFKELGVNGAFVNAKEIIEKVENPTKEHISKEKEDC